MTFAISFSFSRVLAMYGSREASKSIGKELIKRNKHCFSNCGHHFTCKTPAASFNDTDSSNTGSMSWPDQLKGKPQN